MKLVYINRVVDESLMYPNDRKELQANQRGINCRFLDLVRRIWRGGGSKGFMEWNMHCLLNSRAGPDILEALGEIKNMGPLYIYI